MNARPKKVRATSGHDSASICPSRTISSPGETDIIQLSSENARRGATETLRLPRGFKCRADVGRSDKGTVIISPIRRILIVDDEKSVLSILVRFLEAEGYETASADSAEAAIALVDTENFDLILLDVVLPGMTGFSAIEALKRRCSAAVLLMSGDANDDNSKDAILLGAVGMVRKPLDFKELKRAIAGFIPNEGRRPTR